MKLYRPVGLYELLKIQDMGFLGFPPRLPDQSFFYPVLSVEYARQIARDWNPKDHNSGYVGWVTGFEVPDEWAARYPVRVVGSRAHQELWVPAQELEEFNRQLMGPIQILEVYRGRDFTGGFGLPHNATR